MLYIGISTIDDPQYFLLICHQHCLVNIREEEGDPDRKDGGKEAGGLERERVELKARKVDKLAVSRLVV